MSSIVPGVIACGSRIEVITENCDDYPDNTILLMHMDGTDGSTTFIDEKGHTFDVVQSVTISTAQSKFGTASGYFNDPGSKIKIAVSEIGDFDFSTGDFTIETWMRTSDPTAVIAIIGRGYPHNQFGMVYNTVYFGKITGGFVAQTSTGLVSANTWVHLALVRSGTTVTIFVDGVARATGSFPDAYSWANQYIGNGDNTYTFQHIRGHLDELRVTKGVARYTSDFTPPSAPFGVVQCVPPVPDIPSFVIIDKEVPTDGQTEFIPGATSNEPIDAGGRNLVILGSNAYCVNRNVQDEVVMFDKTSLSLLSRDNTGTILRFLDLCSNGSNKIYALFEEGVLVYQPTGSALNRVLSSAVYDGKQLKYASGSLFLRKSGNIQKLNSSTLALEIETAANSISSDSFIDTDGTHLYVYDPANSLFIKINGTTNAVTSYDATAVSGFQLVINGYAYFANHKINLTTGTVSAHSLALTHSSDSNGTFISKFNNVFTHYNEISNGKGTIRIIDSTDDSVVSTIVNFEEIYRYGFNPQYKKPAGIGMLSEEKIIISNGSREYEPYSSGYSVYELQ